MRPNTIICISREYGSGGHEIAEKLSEDLGIKLFDKELIARVAKMADVSEEYISQREETGDYAYIFGVPIGHPATTPMDECILTPEKLFVIQSIAIRQIAEQEKSCIFVGRCADVILQKLPGCHSFFIHSSEAVRIQRIMDTEDVSEREAKRLMKKVDQERASYHNYYTKIKWGHPSNYELVINTGRTGIDKAVKVIESYLEE